MNPTNGKYIDDDGTHTNLGKMYFYKLIDMGFSHNRALELVELREAECAYGYEEAN